MDENQASAAGFYYSLEAAAAELLRREGLRREVEVYWDTLGYGRPPLPPIANMAVMTRHVATFRYEDAVFSLMARRAGLHPVWFEYTGDRMVHDSPVKMSLLAPLYCSGRGRQGGFKLTKDKLVNIGTCEGRPIAAIQTSRGESLVEYHHRHLARMVPNPTYHDFTEWLAQIGRASDYYVVCLTMYIAHGVLFEDFHGGESGNRLDKFTSEVFEPAWMAVTRRFGVSPLVVPLPWRPGFEYYPADERWREHGVIPSDLL